MRTKLILKAIATAKERVEESEFDPEETETLPLLKRAEEESENEGENE